MGKQKSRYRKTAFKRALVLFRQLECGEAGAELRTALDVLVDGLAPEAWHVPATKGDRDVYGRLLLYAVRRAADGYAGLMRKLNVIEHVG